MRQAHPVVSAPPRLIRSAVVPPSAGRAGQPPVPPVPPTIASAATPPPADPLADLRTARGWIDRLDERQLWAILVRVRWPQGPQCPRCGEKDARYLKPLDPDYRGGLGRWQCRVCAEAGDPGQAGTFTPLTGTLFDGLRLDTLRGSLWMVVEALADGQASVRTAREVRVNRHTTDRLLRLLRAALPQGEPRDRPARLDARRSGRVR